MSIVWANGQKVDDFNELEAGMLRLCDEYGDLVKKYDDALKRINDLQAENEALKMELARRN